MVWTEIKRWAKEKGYDAIKTDGQYHWRKIDDKSINGIEKSISKLSKAIFNHMTQNSWIEYQNTYPKEQI